jgi:hypothetical protein
MHPVYGEEEREQGWENRRNLKRKLNEYKEYEDIYKEVYNLPRITKLIKEGLDGLLQIEKYEKIILDGWKKNYITGRRIHSSFHWEGNDFLKRILYELDCTIADIWCGSDA